ncbi:MAG: hypothetical protein AMJ75_01910 [Phycisphaerae bacterium SM1_79]|nr:MAG: hypothetical protein AMJ75_01910 [Phycisphaerae bacterium SM1_79]
MNDEQSHSVLQTPSKSFRPVLIASNHTLSEYSLFLAHLLAGLADESIPAALVCPPACDVESVMSGAVEVIRHPIIDLPLLERLNRNRLIEQLVRFQPTVLHCLCEAKASLTRQLARQLSLPYVLMINSLQNRWRQVSISSKHCARITVPAKSIAASVAKAYPRFAERVEQTNIGTFVEEQSGCFSQSSRLPSVVVAHPLNHVAEFENLFGAVRHLAIARYEFMFVVMGAGRAESQLRKLLAALGLSQTVTIVPRLQPWRSVLAAGDIFIQPRRTTVFNPLLLEAMSVGTAVAACKGGVDDLIIEDQTAVVFDPDDELSIRSTLQRLFDRREFARKLAKEAQKYLKENHTVSKMISGTLQVYRQAQQWFSH